MTAAVRCARPAAGSSALALPLMIAARPSRRIDRMRRCRPPQVMFPDLGRCDVGAVITGGTIRVGDDANAGVAMVFCQEIDLSHRMRQMVIASLR